MEGVFVFAFVAAMLFFVIGGFWRVFEKAGRPGWTALIPIYNIYSLLKIANRPGWWLFLFFIPIVSLVVWISMGFDIARKFGKRDGFGIGLGLLPGLFYPILGFSKAQFIEEKEPTLMLDADELSEYTEDGEYEIEVEEWPIQRDQL